MKSIDTSSVWWEDGLIAKHDRDAPWQLNYPDGFGSRVDLSAVFGDKGDRRCGNPPKLETGKRPNLIGGFTMMDLYETLPYMIDRDDVDDLVFTLAQQIDDYKLTYPCAVTDAIVAADILRGTVHTEWYAVVSNYGISIDTEAWRAGAEFERYRNKSAKLFHVWLEWGDDDASVWFALRRIA